MTIVAWSGEPSVSTATHWIIKTVALRKTPLEFTSEAVVMVGKGEEINSLCCSSIPEFAEKKRKSHEKWNIINLSSKFTVIRRSNALPLPEGGSNKLLVNEWWKLLLEVSVVIKCLTNMLNFWPKSKSYFYCFQEKNINSSFLFYYSWSYVLGNKC